MVSHLDVLWIEKYRPKKIQDIVHQNHIKKMLFSVLSTGSMPHCLFYGLPGTGKTSAALALCSELFGLENVKSRVLELNASDDRGISVIRDKIKSWARILVGPIPTAHDVQSPKLDWKVVILDEADMMTADAQSALRRIMEDNVKTTRFIIICNYVSRIIDPIVSRCARFRFNTIEPSIQCERLKYIAKEENLTIQADALHRICQISEGDLRVAIMLLQSAAALVDKELKIRLDHVECVAGIPSPEISEGLLQRCLDADPHTSVAALQEDVTASGWDVTQLLRQLLRCVIYRSDLDDVTKAALVTVQATAHFRSIQGACESLQLLEVLMTMTQETSRSSSAKHIEK